LPLCGYDRQCPPSLFARIFSAKPEVSADAAEVAHLVEHDLAKVGVAGSSPVFRSLIPTETLGFFLSRISRMEMYFADRKT
jgi:hypothetical protein